jgi:hypothetical protein
MGRPEASHGFASSPAYFPVFLDIHVTHVFILTLVVITFFGDNRLEFLDIGETEIEGTKTN